jgi:cytochrome P450
MTDPFTATSVDGRHAALADLAEQGPVHHLMLPTGVAAWVITGYAEARAALADPRFTKGGPRNAPYVDELEATTQAGLNHHMLTADPPTHTRLRRLVSMAFTRRQVERLAPRIEALTAGLLEDVAGRLADTGEVDLLATFAHPLPMTVVCDLLGVPEEGRAEVREWIGPLLVGGVGPFEEYAAAARKMLAYMRELIALKRREPAEDLLTALIEARDGADRLTEDELTSMAQLLFIAGHDTTVGLIVNGVLALLTNPAQLAWVRQDPARWPAAVEELLRFDGPVQVPIPMAATEPVTIAGQTIPAGDHVIVSLLAANRDRRRFPDPDRLDLSRADGNHLAFGHGIHFCLGAPLARLEGRIALRALFDRFPTVELADVDSLTRWPTLLFNRLTALPVRLG